MPSSCSSRSETQDRDYDVRRRVHEGLLIDNVICERQISWRGARRHKINDDGAVRLKDTGRDGDYIGKLRRLADCADGLRPEAAVAHEAFGSAKLAGQGLPLPH